NKALLLKRSAMAGCSIGSIPSRELDTFAAPRSLSKVRRPNHAGRTAPLSSPYRESSGRNWRYRRVHYRKLRPANARRWGNPVLAPIKGSQMAESWYKGGAVRLAARSRAKGCEVLV